MNKEPLENQLKRIMEDEVKDIELSKDLRDQILSNRKKNTIDRVRGFLNKEIEIHLVPMVASFIIFFIVIGFPKDIVMPKETIIDLGVTQLIVRDERRVSRHEN